MLRASIKHPSKLIGLSHRTKGETDALLLTFVDGMHGQQFAVEITADGGRLKFEHVIGMQRLP